MEGARLRPRRTTTAALLGFLTVTLFIPGAFALQCHSYTSIRVVSGGHRTGEFTTGSRVSSHCSGSQNACVEAHLMLSTGNTALLVIHHDCANEELKEGAGPTTPLSRYLTVHSRVRYCRSDLCNSELEDFNVSSGAEQEKANSSHLCYSGITMYVTQDIRDRITCREGGSQCYHGNGAVTAGPLGVKFLIKACQDPSCHIPESQSFGPVELKLWGSCCHGNICNGQRVAAQSEARSTAAPTQHLTRREEDTSPQPTEFLKPDVESDTQTTSMAPEEVTVTPGHEWDIDAGTVTSHNPLYDYEEMEDEDLQGPGGTNNTLNPRTRNLGPPRPRLPLYLLLVSLGIVILGIW